MTDVTEKREPATPEQPPQESASSAPIATTGSTTEATPKPAEKAKTEESSSAAKTAAEPLVTKPADKRNDTKKGGGTVIAVVALILVIGAAAAGYGGWYKLQQQQQALEQRLAAEEQTVSGIRSASQSDTQTLQQQINGLSEAVNAATQHDTLLDERLTDIDKRLEERRSNTWMVSEARYLINIASYQTQLNYNIKTALVALEGADHRLRDLDDPSLLKARQIVTDNIASLRAVTPVDLPGIALLLSQLEQQVTTLPLLDQDAPPATAASATTDTAEVSGPERFLNKIWSDIKGLVVVRHNSGAKGDAVSTPDQRIYLQQNLRLKLEVARLALLQRDTRTFHGTIATIQAWLNRYYDINASSTNAMLSSLTPLATLELQPALPDLSGALHLLDSWQELHKSNTKVETPQQKEPTSL